MEQQGTTAAKLAGQKPDAACQVCGRKVSESPPGAVWTTWNDWLFAYCPDHRWRDVVYVAQVNRIHPMPGGESTLVPGGEWCVHYHRFRFDEDVNRFLAGSHDHPLRNVGDTHAGELCIREEAEAADETLDPFSGFCTSVQQAVRVAAWSLKQGKLSRLGFGPDTPIYLWHAGEPPLRLPTEG